MLKQRLQKASQPIKAAHFGQQQTFCGQISASKLNNRNSLPPRSKMIRRQKITTYNTVEDEPNDKIHDVYIYTTHTPKNPKTQKTYPHQKFQSKDEIPSFKIDESFSNKHITVKKQYQPRFKDQSQDIDVSKDKIALKNYFQCHKRDISEINKSKRQPSAREKQESSSGNGLIVLKDGWKYKGQYVADLFHGFGELYHNDRLIYSGNFQFGYFQGYGKLQAHPSFNYLVQIKTISRICNKVDYSRDQSSNQFAWSAYFGQFHKGNIFGHGELWLSNGQKIASKWCKGAQIGKYWVLSSANSQVD